MTAPILSRERAIEIGWKHVPVEMRPECYGIDPPIPPWIIAALQDAFAAGVAQSEADSQALHYVLMNSSRESISGIMKARFDCPLLNGKTLLESILVAALAQTKEEPQTWTKVSDAQPAPHARYEVRRLGGDVKIIATPCYGMHQPWWVPRKNDGPGEDPPINMNNADLWRPDAHT